MHGEGTRQPNADARLSDAEAITDENLLAATVILRHLEELEGTLPVESMSSHHANRNIQYR